LDRVGKVDAPWRGPEYSKPLAIAGDLGQVMACTDIEKYLRASPNFTAME
jgi:hypothetical protein